MRYVKFFYKVGYTDKVITQVFSFGNSYSTSDIEKIFKDWYELQQKDEGNFYDITKEEAEEIGISVINDRKR